MNLFEKNLKPNPDIIFTVVGEEAILLEQNSGEYYSLNYVGSRIWALLAEHNQLNKAYQELLVEFDVEGNQLRKDLENIVSKLIEKGFIV